MACPQDRREAWGTMADSFHLLGSNPGTRNADLGRLTVMYGAHFIGRRPLRCRATGGYDQVNRTDVVGTPTSLVWLRTKERLRVRHETD